MKVLIISLSKIPSSGQINYFITNKLQEKYKNANLQKWN